MPVTPDGVLFISNVTQFLLTARCKAAWCFSSTTNGDHEMLNYGLTTWGIEALVTLPIGKLFLGGGANRVDGLSPERLDFGALAKEAVSERTVNVQLQAGVRVFFLGGWASVGAALLTVNTDQSLSLDVSQADAPEPSFLAAELRIPYPSVTIGTFQELLTLTLSYAQVNAVTRTQISSGTPDEPAPVLVRQDQLLADGLLVSVGISPIDAVRSFITSTAL